MPLRWSLEYRGGDELSIVRNQPQALRLFLTRDARGEGYSEWMHTTDLQAPEVEPQKRLLRDTRTGCFLTQKGRWTSDPAEARNFPNLLAVVSFCAQHQVHDAELVLQFEETGFEVRLPVRG